MRRVIFCTITLMLLGVRSTSAEAINFNFTGPNANAPSFTFSGASAFVPPPQVTATGDVPGIGGDFVRRTANGLGVGHVADLLNGPFDLDNTGFTETLNVQLSSLGFYTGHTLVGIFLDNIDSNDDVQILLNGSLVQTLAAGTAANGFNALNPIALALNDVIGVKGTGSGLQLGNDDYQVAGIRLNATPAPEPASMVAWGLIGGAGLVVSRLRRKARR